MSSAGVPSSTMRPCSMTSTRSAIATVDSRCAMMIAVRSASRVVQPLLHEPLARDVERRGRLVQDEHGRVGEERAREREQLSLTRRDPPAALVHVGVVAVRQRHDEVVRAHRPRGRPDLVERRVRLAQRDVLGDRPAEQVRLLRDHDDRAAQVLRVQVAQVDAVERDRSGASGRRTASQQLRERRLAGSGRADERDRLPGRDVAGRSRAARPGRPCRRTDAVEVDVRRAPPTGRPAGSGSATLGSSSSTPEIFSSAAAADW